MLSTTTSRLVAFAATLAVAAGSAAALGAATDPRPPFQDCLKVAAAEAGLDAAGQEMGGEVMGGEDMIEAVPGADGLRSQLAGVELEPVTQSFRSSGTKRTFRFRVVDCDGRPVRDMEPEQGKLLHLIVVRTDLTGYQHLHPRLTADGTWETEVELDRPGRYRAIADFVIDGRKYVLGTTLTRDGLFTDTPLPAPSLSASADGFAVELQRPAVLEAGDEAQLTFRVTKGGKPVADLEPYLGAYGHLVALHVPELAYSHVHPDGEDRAAGAITFGTEFEEPGTYRLFLQFQVDGRVHTVGFTQNVS